MRKAVIVLAAVMMLTGCEASVSSQNTDDYVEEVVKDVKKQAAESLKKALASEVSAFFQSDDLSATLGVSAEEREQLEQSIREYIDEYNTDEEKLGEAKEAVEKLFENADGLTAQELQDNIKEIFE